MSNYSDLKKGLAQLSERAAKEHKYFDDPELHEANRKVMEMCKKETPVYQFAEPDDVLPTNITYRALFRVNLLLRKNGINWRILDWKKVLEWLYDNWDKVLRVMLSLLMLIIL